MLLKALHSERANTESPMNARGLSSVELGATALKRFALIASVAITGGLLACGDSPLSADGDQGIDEGVKVHKVAVASVQRQQEFLAMRRFAGRIEAGQRAQMAFELAGKVAKVAVEEGQNVSAGSPLLSLDTRLLETERQQYQAQLREIEAQLERVELDIKRQQQLKQKGLSVAQQLDSLEAEQKALKAQRSRLYSVVRSVNLRLEKSQLIAPFDGEVFALDTEIDEVVNPGQPVLMLIAKTAREGAFGIPQRLGDELKNGDKLRVRTHLGEVEAEVIGLRRSLSTQTLTRQLRMRFDAGLALDDSSIAYVFLPEQRQAEGLWLPVDALVVSLQNTWAVYEAKPIENTQPQQYQLVKRSVTPLYQANGRVYVSASLKDGELIVVNGVHKLAAGQRVRL